MKLVALRYSGSQKRKLALQTWMAITCLLLLAVTWGVWWPTLAVEFPRVPLLSQFDGVPLWVHQCLTIACVFGLLATGTNAAIGMAHGGVKQTSDLSQVSDVSQVSANAVRNKLFSGLVLVSGLALVLLNQHRFQPWFYQLLIFSGLWLLEPGRDLRLSPKFEHLRPRGTSAWWWMQAIVVSVYFYSSIGKLDYQFLHTVGQQFLGAIFNLLGSDVGSVPLPARLWMAAALPASELCLAVMLAFCWWQQSRWLTACSVAAAAFHLALILILGVQLGHSAGVVLWNLQFAGLALLLFFRDENSPESANESGVPSEALHSHPLNLRGGESLRGSRYGLHDIAMIRRLAAVPLSSLALAVIALPLFERWGYWDHWPSWALYAPHSSRVEVMVAPQAVERLPASLQALLTDSDDDTREPDDINWIRLPLAAWSLKELATPIYPQSKFQLSVAQELAAQVDSPFQIQAAVLGPANRLTGKREELFLRGTEDIIAASP